MKHLMSKILGVVLVMALPLMISCDGLVTAINDNPVSPGLKVTTPSIQVEVDETFKCNATASSRVKLLFVSADPSIATVDSYGVITGVKEGKTTVTVTTEGKDSQAKSILSIESVTIPVEVIAASEDEGDEGDDEEEEEAEAATVTTAPTATTGTIAAGSTTALVTAGVADGGTMMYQATTTNTKPTSTTGFSATVPTAEGRAAGTYYVWYYAKADADHTDSDIAATAIEVTVTEVYAANEYNEAEWNSTLGKVEFTKKTAASVTAVTNSDADVTWGDGWYTVSGNVTINGKVTLSANTSLILQDGATLTITGQLNAASYDLDIYGQMEGTGKLNVTCNDNAIKGASNMTTKIHGGEITATATGDSHHGFYFGYIVMYSGKLTATAADYHAIGFNYWGFNVYGGEVEGTSNATTGDFSGIQSSDGTLKVYGGKVKGTGGAPSGKGFDCKVQKGTSNIKFYFSDNGTTWGDGLSYSVAAAAPGNRYAKAE